MTYCILVLIGWEDKAIWTTSPAVRLAQDPTDGLRREYEPRGSVFHHMHAITFTDVLVEFSLYSLNVTDVASHLDRRRRQVICFLVNSHSTRQSIGIFSACP